MSEREGTVTSPEQARYAGVLDWGMRLGLALLTAGFLGYAFGILPAGLPLEDLPRLWRLSAADYLRESGTAGGWAWIGTLGSGDALSLAGIALLAGASVPCLLALIPLYARSRDGAYVVIVAIQVAVLVLAASGVLGSGH